MNALDRLKKAKELLEKLKCDCKYPTEQGCWDCQNTGYDNAEGPIIEDLIQEVERLREHIEGEGFCPDCWAGPRSFHTCEC